MNSKKVLIVMILMALMVLVSLPIAPVAAWTYPDLSEDTVYEKFGPRIDRVYIRMFKSESAEWDALKAGEIDITDWPLSKTYLDEFTTLPYNESINVQFYGAELGYYLVDINNDNGPEKAPGHPNPVYKTNPAGWDQQNGLYKDTAAEFRKALWRVIDREYLISEIWHGLAYPMTTLMVPPHGDYLHPDAYTPVEEGGLYWGFDAANATAILDAAGFVDTDGDGWRNFPEELGGNGENIVLIFYIREDHEERRLMGLKYAEWIETNLNIQVDERVKDRRTTFYEVMVYKNFHLYTGGWSLGRDPDHVVLYQSYYYWHPGFCYNYDRINDTVFDEYVDNMIFANNRDEAIYWAHKCQEHFNRHVFGALFAVCTAGYKAWYRTYTGGTAGTLVSPDDGENQYRGLNWTHLVNLGSYGIDSYFTFLNAYPDSPGTQWGDGEHMTIRWGFKTSTMEKPSNPAYAEWVWDWNVLGLTYDSLLAREPYPPFDWMPWLCKDFEIFTWVDPEDGLTKTGVRFVLRDDVFWSDGTPFTAADVEYSLVELDDELISLGFGPPWWYSNTAYIKSFYLIDPYNIEVLLDVKSYFAVGWIGGCIILPKHVWKALVEQERASQEAGNPPGTAVDFWGPYVDPNVIGTGPFRFVEYVEEDHTLLVANLPGSTVQTTWEGSTPITSPGYFRLLPFDIRLEIIDPPELAYRHKIEPGITATMQLEFENLWAQPLPVYGWLTLNGTPVAGSEFSTELAPFESMPVYSIIGELGCFRDYGWWHFNGTHIEMTKIIVMHADSDVEIWYGDALLDTVPECTWFVLDFHFEIPAIDSLATRFDPIKCIPMLWEISWWQKTLPVDIGGKNMYDELADGAEWVSSHFPGCIPDEVVSAVSGLREHPYKEQIPVCDYKVDIRDVATAARAFGSYPGHPRWSSPSDVIKDYKVDIRDIANIARYFGWIAPWKPPE